MKRKTIFTRLAALLIILSVLFSVLTACNNESNSQDEQDENTPEFSGVFLAEDGEFNMDGGDVFTTEDDKLSLKITAVLQEEYYNQLKTQYGSTCELSFYASAGKIVEEKAEIIAEKKIPTTPISFTTEGEKSVFKVTGSVEIEGYGFTGAEFFAFFDEGYFGQIFMAVKHKDNGATVYDKITAFGTETFEDYSDRGDNIKISQFNVYNLMMPANKSFMLMEDVDFSKLNYTASDKAFSGVFDGQGFAIKNLKPKARYDGLFSKLETGAQIRNVAFIDVDLSHGEISGVFGETRRSVKFSNIFVTVSSSFLGTGTGFMAEVWGGEQTYENIFIYSKATAASNRDRTGVLVGRNYAKNNMILNNCHFVANPSCYNPNNDGLLGDDYNGVYHEPNIKGSGYQTYTSIDKVNVGEDSSLTDFMKDCIKKYVNN